MDADVYHRRLRPPNSTGVFREGTMTRKRYSVTRRRFLRDASLTSIGLVAVACAPGTTPSGTAAPSAAAGVKGGQYPEGAVKGGTMVVGIGSDPTTLNVGWSTATETQMVAISIFESLLIDTSEGGNVPNLAESWEITDGGRTYTFKLRKGVQWHDGQPFTSADVKFTAEEVWKKLHSRNRGAMRNLTVVETPDVNTAVFRFSAPYGGLLASLGKYDGNVIPKHIYGDGTDITKHPRNLDRPIGTGPFKWVEHIKGDRITVERNANYWRTGQPFLDKIVFKVIPDATARGLAIEAGDVDFLPTAALPPLTEVQRLRNSQGVVVQDYKTARISQGQTIMFNLRRPEVGKVEVRQAIAHLVDKKVLVDRIMLGYASTMDGPLSDPWYDPNVSTKYELSVAKADELLNKAGFPKKADGTRFKLVLSLESTRFSTPRTAEVIKESLKQVGIDVEIKGEEASTAQNRMFVSYDYDMGLPGEFVGTGPDPAAGVRAWYHSTVIGAGIYNNGARYSNPQVDKLLDDAQNEPDTAKRKVMLGEMVKIVTTELPYQWLMSPKRLTVHRGTISNFAWTDAYQIDYAAVYQVPK
jgi:peptide/nickel transport system substrate-binding protein